jgi:hypothetical protein
MTPDLPTLVPFRDLVRAALTVASVPVVAGSRRNAGQAAGALRLAREQGDPSPELLAALGWSAPHRRRSA